MNLKFRRKKKLDKDALTQEIITALRSVYDPEIPVNIYDLGLIYTIEIADNADVNIQMTLTTPACPVAQTFPATVQESVKKVPQVQEVTVELVWDPPWSQDNMSEAAKLQLGLL
jgi:FeS assembly SUF system protein